jgi:hypothetical protein
LAELFQRTSPDEENSAVLYIGSLFDYDFPRSQYLYLHGPGGDGKSTLIASIIKMFAKQGVTTMDADDMSDKHSTSSLEGVRLLIFPDLKRPSLPSSGIFKKITGDDTITVNPKGIARHNIVLSCKVIISSNDAPKLDGGRADLRRIIPIKFSPYAGGADHDFLRRFDAATTAIAQYCYSKYCAWRMLNPTQDLPRSEAALEEVKSATTEAIADGLAVTLFEVTKKPEDFAPGVHVEDVIKGASGSDFGMKTQLRKWLAAHDRISKDIMRNGKRQRGYEGLVLLPGALKYYSQS